MRGGAAAGGGRRGVPSVFLGTIETLRNHPELFNGVSYPDTPCNPYMPISWGGFGGQWGGIYGSPIVVFGIRILGPRTAESIWSKEFLG